MRERSITINRSQEYSWNLCFETFFLRDMFHVKNVDLVVTQEVATISTCIQMSICMYVQGDYLVTQYFADRFLEPHGSVPTHFSGSALFLSHSLSRLSSPHVFSLASESPFPLFLFLFFFFIVLFFFLRLWLTRTFGLAREKDVASNGPPRFLLAAATVFLRPFLFHATVSPPLQRPKAKLLAPWWWILRSPGLLTFFHLFFPFNSSIGRISEKEREKRENARGRDRQWDNMWNWDRPPHPLPPWIH